MTISAPSASVEQMMNEALDLLSTTDADARASRPAVTSAVTRGAARLFADLGYASIPEFHLPNGRRADLAGLSPKGEIAIAEVKSGVEDYAADAKWPDYLGFCDAFYFAVGPDFPRALLPDEAGLIIADRFGGAVVRDPPARNLAAARRKALTLRFARQAAARLGV